MSPTDRKGELQLDPKPVPHLSFQVSLCVALAYSCWLPAQAWSFVRHICMVAAALFTFSVTAACGFCGFQNVALERPDDRCWTSYCWWSFRITLPLSMEILLEAVFCLCKESP